MASAILCVDLRLVGQPVAAAVPLCFAAATWLAVTVGLLVLAGLVRRTWQVLPESGKYRSVPVSGSPDASQGFDRRRCVSGICSGIGPMQAGVLKGFRSRLT
jgi:hypothetical protein